MIMIIIIVSKSKILAFFKGVFELKRDNLFD
jgi:hypothetical protein